jgi:hypothetical protein
LHFGTREGRTDFLLDGFGGGFADQHAVVAADVIDDGFVELVAAHADRTRIDHAAQGDHAHFGGAAADIHHHRAGRVGHRHAGADGRGHGLFDQIDVAGAGAEGRFTDGATLDLGGAAGHADDDARAGREQAGVVNLLDELLEHLLGHGEVGDHAVLHRPDGRDVARRLAQHLLGRHAHGQDGFLGVRPAFGADRHHGRFVEDDALAANVDQGVGGAKVDGEIVRKIGAQGTKHRRKIPEKPLGGVGNWGNRIAYDNLQTFVV